VLGLILFTDLLSSAISGSSKSNQEALYALLSSTCGTVSPYPYETFWNHWSSKSLSATTIWILVPVIAGLYARHKKEKTKPNQEELTDLLAGFVRHGKALFFVLDALDEMRVEDRPILLWLLTSLDAKLFVTSRPLDVLQKRYSHAQFFEIAATRADLDLHVQHFLRHSPEVAALLDGTDLEQHLVEAIHHKSGGM
jgi:hypothetical protein